MIPRYSPPEIAQIWSDEARFGTWLEVELLATEAWAALGAIPQADALACRELAPIIDEAFVNAVAERERITDHDVAAFVDVVQASIGLDAGKWIHFGLTSSDVVDTALAAMTVRALDKIADALDGLIACVKTRAREFSDVAMVGRTHGIHAEPTTFGNKLALWGLQLIRDKQRLEAARLSMAVGKLSGAVGTYSNIDPMIEESVCARLGLTPVPATQVLSRDRHAEVFYVCAAIGSTIELMATEVRHLQRSEVREAEEGFRPGQKGSSAMPHKRNPILSERLSGLSRILRANLSASLENVALWHERDISHSSVERVILPDTTILTYYMLQKATSLLSNLSVSPEAMMATFDKSFGLVFSQPVLLALVSSGLSRDEAYRIVQEDAMKAWESRTGFRAVLEADPRVEPVKEALDEAFDLDRALRYSKRALEKLEEIS